MHTRMHKHTHMHTHLPTHTNTRTNVRTGTCTTRSYLKAISWVIFDGDELHSIYKCVFDFITHSINFDCVLICLDLHLLRHAGEQLLDYIFLRGEKA